MYEYFNNVPISINNLYGDPFIQKENTYKKLDELYRINHKGIISIITKSEINEKDAEILKKYSEQLNIIVLVSISELPFEIEKVKGNRYNTLTLCNTRNIPCIAYIRPFIPNYNTNEEVIEKIFYNIYKTGTRNIIISGLRGNDKILEKSNIKDLENWSQRVKIIPTSVRNFINKQKKKYNDINIFERTSCGISYVLGKNRSYNPYWISPQLAKCYACPLKSSCFDKQEQFNINNKDIELCNFLGYDVEKVNNGLTNICKVNPQKRTECKSCCTSCFVVQRESLKINNSNVNLGDVGLLRLLLQKHVFAEDCIDTGNSNIARPNVLNNYNLYILNSWWSYSNNIKKCYGCTYCIVPTYNNECHEYGILPEYLYEELLKRRKIK